MIVDLLVPGRLDSRSGGSLYDAHAVAALRRRGVAVRVHELAGRFPAADDTARTAVVSAFARAAGVTVIDGLCLTAVADANVGDGQTQVALMHHPAALETGLADAVRVRLATAERVALAACARVVTTSGLTARQVVEDYGVASGKVRVVLPGVAAAPLATGGQGCDVRLIAVGAVIPRKGYDVLVAGLSRIKDLPWRLDIYGSLRRDPGCAQRLRRDVFRYGLAQRVRLHGEVGESALWGAYSRADAFVLATRYEGYGMVFSEALARGLPVVAGSGGAVAEAVGDAGLLAEPGDVGGLARHLRTVVGDRAARRRLVHRARQRRVRQRSWDDAGAALAAALTPLAQ